jgi:hypothetical protein
MRGMVVRKIEQLESLHKSRFHPTVTIVGELANNLLISGFIRPTGNGGSEARVVKLSSEKASEFKAVVSILEDLSSSNVFEVIDDEMGKRIRMYPKPTSKREGN